MENEVVETLRSVLERLENDMDIDGLDGLWDEINGLTRRVEKLEKQVRKMQANSISVPIVPRPYKAEPPYPNEPYIID